jgi:hypothetical protein
MRSYVAEKVVAGLQRKREFGEKSASCDRQMGQKGGVNWFTACGFKQILFNYLQKQFLDSTLACFPMSSV